MENILIKVISYARDENEKRKIAAYIFIFVI